MRFYLKLPNPTFLSVLIINPNMEFIGTGQKSKFRWVKVCYGREVNGRRCVSKHISDAFEGTYAHDLAFTRLLDVRDPDQTLFLRHFGQYPGTKVNAAKYFRVVSQNCVGLPLNARWEKGYAFGDPLLLFNGSADSTRFLRNCAANISNLQPGAQT